MLFKRCGIQQEISSLPYFRKQGGGVGLSVTHNNTNGHRTILCLFWNYCLQNIFMSSVKRKHLPFKDSVCIVVFLAAPTSNYAKKNIYHK